MHTHFKFFQFKGFECVTESFQIEQDIPPNIELLPPPVGLEEAFQVLFTKDCLNFLKELMEKFEEQIDQVINNHN